MVTLSPQKAKYEYFALSFHLEDVDMDQWETLFKEDKATLSREIYRLIDRETPALKDSARKTASKNERKHSGRRLFLIRLPEYEHVIRFVKTNIRRPAFKAHLKRLLLHDSNVILPAEEAFAPSPEPTDGGQPEAPRLPESRLRSPRELFGEPGKFIQTMIAELKKPETNRLYDWDEIPPQDYPETITSTMLFSRLEDYWHNKNKAL